MGVAEGGGDGGDAPSLVSTNLFPLLEPKIRDVQKNYGQEKRIKLFF